MIIASIDYSMTSPAICVADSNTDIKFDKCFFYNISDIKNKPMRKNIHYTQMPHYKNDEDRFDKLSNWAIEILKANEVETVIIEGYSFGSKSNRLFQIGENCGILKFKIFSDLSLPIITIPPTEIKKIYSGNGNASKDMMVETLFNKENIKLGENSKSPISDIIDSYAIFNTYMEKQKNV